MLYTLLWDEDGDFRATPAPEATAEVVLTVLTVLADNGTKLDKITAMKAAREGANLSLVEAKRLVERVLAGAPCSTCKTHIGETRIN